MKKEKMTETKIHDYLKEQGTKGGNAVLKKYGKSFYKKIINKRWAAYRRKKKEKVIPKLCTFGTCKKYKRGVEYRQNIKIVGG